MIFSQVRSRHTGKLLQLTTQYPSQEGAKDA